MPKTLTAVGIEKIGRRFADSVDHAAYTLNGAPKTVKPFRKLIEADTVKIYVYFDDTVSGTWQMCSSSTRTGTSSPRPSAHSRSRRARVSMWPSNITSLKKKRR